MCRVAVVCLGLVLAAGCSSSESTGPGGRPSGNWKGSLATGTFTFSLDVVLVEDAAGKVTGNGYLATALSGSVTTTAAVTATGTFAAPHLSVNLSSPGFNTLNVSGKISTDTIDAVLNGSGFNSEKIVLTRQ